MLNVGRYELGIVYVIPVNIIFLYEINSKTHYNN